MSKKYPRFFVLQNPPDVLKNYIARVSVPRGILYYTLGSEKFEPYPHRHSLRINNFFEEHSEKLAEKHVRTKHWKEITKQEAALKLLYES